MSQLHDFTQSIKPNKRIIEEVSVLYFQITRSNEQANDYIEDLDLVSEESLAYEDYYIEETSDAKNTSNYQCGVRNERGVEVMLRRFQFRVNTSVFNTRFLQHIRKEYGYLSIFHTILFHIRLLEQ